MDAQPTGYSMLATAALIAMMVVTAPFAVVLAIVFLPPWLFLGFYIAKRIWRGHSQL